MSVRRSSGGTPFRAVILPLLGLLACVPARHKVEGTIVRDLRFEGNAGWLSGQGDYLLRGAVETKASGFGLGVWPLIYTVDPKSLRDDVLVRDAYRLETWYAHHGWFDARVQGWEVREVRPRHDRRAGVVDLVGHVEPGEPSLIRSMTIDGLSPALTAVANAVLRNAPVREGSQFDLASVQATRATLLQKLQDHARPYASVELEVVAHPEEHVVDVRFHASAGITGEIGPVTIAGTEKVPERFVDDALRLDEGQGYQFQALRDAQRRLFEMGTFSVATVQPDLSDPTREAVPIEVRVTESKFRTVRLGVGFDYDGYLPVLRTSARFRHVNLLHELLRLDVSTRAGVAVDFAAGTVAQTLPTWGVDVLFRDPRLFSRTLSLELATTVEQDIYGGLWTYFRPEADLYVVYRYSDAVQLRFGPHAEQYRFLGEFGPRVEAAQQRLFGIEADEAFRYELTSLDQYGQWDWRDDPVRTTRGSWYSVFLREAFPITPQGYGFFKASAEARRYVPVRFGSRRAAFPLTLAGRTAGELIVPFEAGGNIPLPERAFLGGPNSLRGFRTNQVGPYTTLCTYETVDTLDGFMGITGEPITEQRVTRYHLPEGGIASAEAGLEARYDWIYGILLSMFVDVGGLTSDLGTVGVENLRYSGGVGARYDTIVGPLRFDLSFRQLYPEDLGPERYTACLEPDQEPRVSDFFGNFGDLEHPSFAMVFFVTFGEAF